MNIGWILVLCALVLLLLLAIGPWLRKERTNNMVDVSLPDQRESSDPALLDQIIRLLLNRQKIQAIKVYRQYSGIGLSEAKAAIDYIEQALREDPQAMTENQFVTLSAQNDAALLDQVIRLLLARQKIQAIKVYRQHSGTGLREAKAAVDYIEQALREDPQTMTENQFVTSSGQTKQPFTAQELEELSSSTDVTEFISELERFLNAGQKINAIKFYREKTGTGLREAKEAVDRLEATMWSAEHGQVSGSEIVASGDTYKDQPGEEVVRLVTEGKTIQAIKAYREQTGASLKDARDAISLIGK